MQYSTAEAWDEGSDSLTSNDYTGVVVEEAHIVKSRVSNGVDVRWSLERLLCSVVKYKLIAVDV